MKNDQWEYTKTALGILIIQFGRSKAQSATPLRHFAILYIPTFRPLYYPCYTTNTYCVHAVSKHVLLYRFFLFKREAKWRNGVVTFTYKIINALEGISNTVCQQWYGTECSDTLVAIFRDGAKWRNGVMGV